MRTCGRVLIVTLAVACAGGAVILTAAEPPQQPGQGWTGLGSAGARVYNPATVETIEGTIVGVERLPSAGRWSDAGIHLTVRTSSETVPVHLGPASYLQQLLGPEASWFAEGEHIMVTGSRVMYNGQPAVVAARLQRAGATLTLRTPAGLPAWSAWGSAGGGVGRGLGPGHGQGYGRGMGRGAGRGAGARWRR